MRKIILILIIGILGASQWLKSQNNNIGLVVRMDDMGAFHSANTACIDGFTDGIATTVEVMVVTPWFPEAVKMLKKTPLLDVGLHLTLTSEWENMKWRPLTNCPSLTDTNGYFYPMMSTNKAYPNSALKEQKWNIDEVEQELKAQIVLGLKNIPQTSHITGHMGALTFDPKVMEIVEKLAKEYDLSFVYGEKNKEKYNVNFVGYSGSTQTNDIVNSFIKSIEGLEKGKNYIFLDHPMYSNEESSTVSHIGNETVSEDRQNVIDLLKNQRVKDVIVKNKITLINYNELTKSLPRSTPLKEKLGKSAISNYVKDIEKNNVGLHSLMIVRNGKVIGEQWFGEHGNKTPHTLYSVSKTFTAMAIGFAIDQKLLTVDDKVTSFFPDELPTSMSENLKLLSVKDLLTMAVGHDVKLMPISERRIQTEWQKWFLSLPINERPGSQFTYNSMASYMLSAIVQKVTGEKVIDYLYPRLFRPLGIVGAEWSESPEQINSGGWGLSIKTEDMAKFGQLILQRGQWDGKQLVSEKWIDEMTSKQIESRATDMTEEVFAKEKKTSDWTQGYCYQMWRCKAFNAFRADGANGQFIIIIPEKNAVVINTANNVDMQLQINLIWKHIVSNMK